MEYLLIVVLVLVGLACLKYLAKLLCAMGVTYFLFFDTGPIGGRLWWAGFCFIGIMVCEYFEQTKGKQQW